MNAVKVRGEGMEVVYRMCPYHEDVPVRDGPLFFWRGGGDEKSLSANFFFIYAPLQTIFF